MKLEPFIKEYADRVKVLIRNEENLDNEELDFQIEELQNEYYDRLEIESDHGYKRLEGTEIVPGLITKLRRIHLIGVYSYDRDYESLLAEKMDLGVFEEEKPCPYEQDEDTLTKLQRSVTLFLAKRAKVDPTEDDPEFADILLTGKPVHLLEPEKMQSIIATLTELTHSFVKYIDCYKPHLWHWAVDCIVISQYIFEKIAEITYKIYKGEDTDGWSYNIREAFQYYEIEASEDIQNQINNKIETLENLVSETASFIDEKDIDTCDFEVWLRPIFFNIGVLAMQFTLEQENL